MKQKEIYIADLEPTKGHEQKGIRPIVVISGNTMNNHLGICIACPISSKIKNYPQRIRINKSKKNGLNKDSEIIPAQIRSISKTRLKKKLGKITNEELKKIFEGLGDILSY